MNNYCYSNPEKEKLVTVQDVSLIGVMKDEGINARRILDKRLNLHYLDDIAHKYFVLLKISTY